MNLNPYPDPLAHPLADGVAPFTAAERARLPPYPPALGCDAKLNLWCDEHCPHFETQGALLARRTASTQGPSKAWRCFARSSLLDDAASYRMGSTTYCTRDGQLQKQLQRCLEAGEGAAAATADAAQDTATATVAVDATGETRVESPPKPQAPPRSPKPPPPPEAWIDGPRGFKELRSPQGRQPRISGVRPPPPPSDDGSTPPPPHYEHDASLMVLSPRIAVPSAADCAAELASAATFLAVSMYTDAYAHKAEYLRASCEAHSICCALSHVPNDAFGESAERDARHQTEKGRGDGKLPNSFRHRLIASKPLFILRALHSAAPLPVAWLDVDLEFHQRPLLFEPASWPSGPRDALLWNWQGNVSGFQGRRLKMASGVAFFNQTDAARAVLAAWAQVMAYPPNAASPDDQAMDLLVNDDGWIDRVRWGWLPAAYLRMLPRHQAVMPTAAHAVLDHDRGAMPGKGNSPVKPVLPPRKQLPQVA